MKAMILRQTVQSLEENLDPLQLTDLPAPDLDPEQILVRISSCGVCSTDLDEVEGRVQPRLPMALGHQIIGRAEKLGSKVKKWEVEDRVGIAWINWACGACRLCLNGEENLCEQARFTGKDVNGGYSQDD